MKKFIFEDSICVKHTILWGLVQMLKFIIINLKNTLQF